MPGYRLGIGRLEPGPTVMPAWVAGQGAPPKGKILPPCAERRASRTLPNHARPKPAWRSVA